MDFLAKLKGRLTGDWAEVTMPDLIVRRGETVSVPIEVAVKDSDITVDAVRLEVTCTEIVEGHDYVPSTFPTTDAYHDTDRLGTLFDEVFDAAGPQDLAAGSTHTFTVDVAIPEDLPASHHGRQARIEWTLFARLDMEGNDPDSGVQQLTVK